MDFIIGTVIMSRSEDSSLPSYSEMKEKYPERTEEIEDNVRLHSKTDGLEEILTEPEVPEIISDAEELDYHDIITEYDQSTVFNLIDYGLLENDLDGLWVSTSGEQYLELLNDIEEEEVEKGRGFDYEMNEDDLWTPEAEIENSFSRYEKDLETMRNVFEGRNNPGDHIRWDELPEVSDDFSDEPNWYSKRSSQEGQGPDWIRD